MVLPSGVITLQATLSPPTSATTLELNAVYRAHAELVKRWALRLGGPGLDAEDIVHEVFLVAHRRLREFRGDAKLTTWLYRITLRIVRKQAARQKVGRWLRGLVGDFAADLPDERVGPYESIERQEAARLVYRALDGLAHNQRAVVILFELEGHSGEEIAALMDTKLATIWVWLHRGRAKFLERLRALGGDSEAKERGP
jgi:RNA polymerase sigma-70 factor (ECF subfamily)